MKNQGLGISRLFGILILSSLLLSACGTTNLTNAQDPATPVPTVVNPGSIDAEGQIVPRDTALLSFETGGKIADILVQEGQAVSKGDVLISLGNREQVEASLATAHLEQMSAQQELDRLSEDQDLAGAQASQALSAAQTALTEATRALDDLDTQDFRDDLDDKEIAVQDAQDELDDAQDEADKFTDLDEDNPTRTNADDALEDAQQAYTDAVYERDVLANQLEEARQVVALAQAQVDAAQREVDAWKDGPDPDKLALAQSRLDAAKSQSAAAERALSNMDLIAPYDGTVLNLNHLAVGESISAGKTAVTFADLSEWYVETKDLTEMDVVEVAIDQPVTISPDAIADLSLMGEVVSIDGAYSERSGDILYTVRIRLLEDDERLRWGMTVNVEFEK